jgi:hypothetical protein
MFSAFGRFIATTFVEMSFEDAVQDEIIALESIYGDELRRSRTPLDEIALMLPVSVELDKKVLVKDVKGSSKQLNLSHLPPILLQVILEPGYPFVSPPRIKLQSSWTLLNPRWMVALTEKLLDCKLGLPPS